MRSLPVALVLAASSMLAACGGGGGTTPVASTAAAGTASPGSSNSPSSAKQVSTTFHVTIPAPSTSTQSTQRHAQYISAGTNTIYITAGDGPINFAPIATATFTVDSTNCTSNTDGTQNCTFTASEPVGELFYVALGVNISGGVSQPLELGGEFFTVVNGGPNNLGPLSLAPILAAQTLTEVSSNVPSSVTFALSDASSQLIQSDTFAQLANLPTITDTDTTGQTNLVIPGFTTPSNSVQPVDVSQAQLITLNYNPTSATAPTDYFTLVVQTIGYSVNGASPYVNNYFPQASPVPSSIPPITTTYNVLCYPGNSHSLTYANPVPGCYLTTAASFTLN
jgi:hypothetical protein